MTLGVPRNYTNRSNLNFIDSSWKLLSEVILVIIIIIIALSFYNHKISEIITNGLIKTYSFFTKVIGHNIIFNLLFSEGIIYFLFG